MKKLIVILLMAGAIAAGGAYYFKHRHTRAGADTPSSAARVTRGPIVSSVSTTGRVVPNFEVQIKCKASGEVIKLPYDVSDFVRKSNLLVELDPVDEERLVKQAEVSLSASRAQLAKARLDLVIAEDNLVSKGKRAEAELKSAQAHAQDARAKKERMKQLLEKEFISQEQYDTAETAAIQATANLENARVRIEELKTEEQALELKRQDVHLADARVESDRINLLNAQQRLQDTKVIAPIDGIVSARYVQIGQIISSGISNVGGGTTVMELADLSRLFILASVDESDIGKVKVGQQAMITADAFAGTSFRGEVVRIATKGVNTSNVVTFEAKVEVLGQNKSLLKPEMTANLEMIVSQEEDALLVPSEAVYVKDGQRYVTVVKEDGNTEERTVEVGISDSAHWEITDGLKEGESVTVHKGEAESRWRKEQRPQGSGSSSRTSRRPKIIR